ncbi:uncharacterized protein LOC101894888 [Musca domestica]|uniref:Uncharacterized protein LOC101894888 n=1 Tax=Musca domestica TaxID=7370 RepID=A0A9J7D1R6_MUSDO|nr:uncharacterized protein LOC101894888 [Musca domestica]
MHEEGREFNKFSQYMYDNPKLKQEYSLFCSQNPMKMNRHKFDDHDAGYLSKHNREEMLMKSKMLDPNSHEDNLRRLQMERAMTSGGDADRFLCDNRFHSSYYKDPSNNFVPWTKNRYCANDSAYETHAPLSSCQCHVTNACVTQPTEIKAGDKHKTHETGSTIGGICIGSEGSEKSRMSPKTVISRRSSHDLKKFVRSQCKLEEDIAETLKKFDAIQTDAENCEQSNKSTVNVTKPSAQCEHCTTLGDDNENVSISQQQFPNNPAQDAFTITADEIVNSKVINPMIRKLRRMCMNSLREEMSLMEDLERLPHSINELYKAAVFHQNK